MTSDRRPDLSKWLLLLPLAYLLHLGEEWWGGEGFVAWTARALGRPVSETRFLILNAIVWPLFCALTLLAFRKRSLAWFPATFGTVVLINAGLHVLGTVVSASYSPGLVTGVFLYLPLGGLAVKSGRRELPESAFGLAVFLGVVIHGVVAVIAFA
ncbi:MAG TPA: HXXEE domain-containing protein [Thermoanaerobaculia bacterium]|nr:HXXEE domain-containing protein [Thermoanaerobaculia bacterium]